MAQMTQQGGARRQQQQEAEDQQQQEQRQHNQQHDEQLPWTPQLQTPSRFRTPDSKLARRGRAIAAEFSSQRKRRESHGGGGDGGYTFNFLPEEGVPVTPGVPGSARKRKDTIASSNATMMMVDESSPARYSPDKVKEAIMSFADFLHFLQKELDLAICEAQQNLDLIRDLGNTIQQQELQLASWQLEKQSWEEKYQLAAQEIENLKREGTMQIQQLTNQVTDFRNTNATLEEVARERQNAIESIQKDNDQLRGKVEQFENERSSFLQENGRLGEQQQQQMATLQRFEQEMNEMKQMCQTEKQKADSLELEVEAWKRKLREAEESAAELEAVLGNERRERDQQAGSMTQLVGETHRFQAQLEAMRVEYEDKLQKQQELVSTLETSRREAQQQLQHASEQYGDLLKRHESESALAMRQLEENFLHEKARFGDQVEQELRKLKHENDELRAQMQSLRELNQGRSAEIERLMASHHELELLRQQREPEDSERMRQLEEELENVKADYEQLYKELSEKDEAHQEELQVQSDEFQTQYSEFVTQVEGQLGEATEENDQLRSQLEEVDAERKRILHQAELLSIAKEDEEAKWVADRDQLQSRLQVFERETAALRRELDLRRQELELKTSENRDLTEQIGNYLAPNNERSQQVELLQRERVRLEEQNRDLRMQMEVAQSELNTKIQEADQIRSKAVEQESTHRHTIRSVYMEKEETDRNMMNLLSEKSMLERQLNATAREKDEILESMTRLEKEKRNAEAQLRDLMKQATEKLEAQHQNAAMLNQDAQTQLQNLNAELLQRDEQMSRGQQQLRSLQDTVHVLEETNRQLQRDLESANGWTTRLKMDIENLQSEKRALESIQALDTTSNRLEKQRAVEALSATYEQFKSELLHRVLEEEEKVQQLHSQLSANETHHHEQLRELMSELEETRRARDQLQGVCSGLEREIQALEEEISAQATILEEARHLEAAHSELQLAHEQLKNDAMSQIDDKSATIAELEEHSANLQATLEREQERSRDLQAQTRPERQGHSEEKSGVVTTLRNQLHELELTVKQLRSKIQTDEEIRVAKEQSTLHEKMQREREVRSLQSRCEGLANDIVELQREVAEKSRQNGELERVMKENGLEIQRTRQNAGVALPSKLQQVQESFHVDRQQLQSKIDELIRARDAIDAEKHELQEELNKADEELDALRHVNQEHIQELNQKDEELDHLKQVQQELVQDLDKKDEVFDSFKQENEDLIHELDKKDETLDALQDTNEKQAQELDKQNEELVALKRTNNERLRALAGKDEELVSVKQEGKEYRIKLDKKQKELDELKRENEEQVKKLQLVEKRDTRRSQRQGDFDRFESALQSRLASLQQKYDQVLGREEDLAQEVATLKAEKSEIKDTIKRELQKLNVDDDSKPTDNLMVRGDRLRLLELVQSYQARESRLDALLGRKDAQISGLKGQVEELKSSARSFESQIEAKQQHYEMDVNDFDKEVEALGREVSKLKMENRKLRERRSEQNEATSRQIIEEWERKYSKLNTRVRELHEENSKLKQRQLSRTEMKRLVDEIDTLSSLVKVKDVEIQELKHRNESTKVKSSRSHHNSSSASTSGGSHSRRMKELLLLVQQKEDKIMVLNDHMTELMKQAVKLQYENECYVVQYGALSENATAAGDPIRAS